MKKKTANVKPRPKPAGEAKDGVPDSEDEGIVGWLKTSAGMEYMTMFVVLNSFIVFLTMSWPQMKQAWGSNPTEMIGLGLLRGAFLGGIMMWYSMSVWKTVDQYFRDQFQEYLTKEYEENTAMKKDVLQEKERLAAKKFLMEKLAKLETSRDGQLEPDYGPFEGMEGEMPYSSEPGEQGVDGEGWTGYADHVDYSVEEVESGQGPGEGTKEPKGYDEPGGGPPFEEEEDAGEGECLVEDCGDQGDRVSTKWRNVFDEDGEVCRFDDHLSAQGSCTQPDELEDEFEFVKG